MDKIFGLHNIEGRESASKARKRVGRGNASGHGSYSGKGRKGQKSRTGSGNGLKIFALRQLIMRTPKLRGFKSLNDKPAVFNVSDIAKSFKDGEAVNLASLREKKMISKNTKMFKILGDGEMKINVSVEGGKVSSVAKEKIEKAGGKIS